ncbi:MAG TPA: prenyltransferase [Noviherbaspirillum sp.]
MPTPIEPSLATLPNPLIRYIAATRPAFLSMTFFGCMLGFASAVHDKLQPDPLTAALTLLFALVAHAGANVLNDYFDAKSGADALNTERIFPFTGGSRFIQNGVLSVRATGIFGYSLLLSVIPAGLWLTMHSGPGLILIGLCGLLAGWAYSAPPLQLASRGLGETAVTAGWLLIVVGSDFVQRGEFRFTPVAAGLCFALLSAKLLYINQFPDARADTQAGKHTLVVRLGTAKARWGYLVLAVAAYGWIPVAIASGLLPRLAWLAMLPAVLSALAARQLWMHAATPQRLAPAIKLSILSATAHAALMALALLV